MHYQDYILKAKISKQTADLIGSIPLKITNTNFEHNQTIAPIIKLKDIFNDNFCTILPNCSYYRSSDLVKKMLNWEKKLKKFLKKF